jgi:hypothetical protein
MNALFKDQYSKQVTDALPTYSYVLSNVAFVGGSEKAGRELKQPIILSRVHGFTCQGTDDVSTTLRKPTTAVNDVASVRSCAYTGRQFVTQTVLARASGGAASFVEATSYVVQNLQESFAHMIESQHLYGLDSYGLVASGSEASATVDGVTFTNGVNVANKAVRIAVAEFAEGLWMGADGMPVDLVNPATGAVVFSGIVASTDPIFGVLFFEDISTMPADPRGFAFYRAGYKDVEVPGIFSILKNTGTLYGINSVTRRLWRANQFNAAGNLNFNSLQQAVTRSMGRGLADKLALHVNPRVFGSIIPDFNTVKDTGATFKSRVFNESSEVKDLVHGAQKLKFYVAGQETEIISNPMIKAGYAIGLEESALVRVGSTTATFDLPGSEGVYFRPLQDESAVELRIYCDEAIFSRKNNGHLIISGITY